MGHRGIPKVLIIDDDLGDTTARSVKTNLENNNKARVKVLHPRDVELVDLQRSNLILIDFDLQEWKERNNLDSISLKPMDGLALSGVLRRHIQRESQSCPVAIAIYSGKLNKLAAPLPCEAREHILARLLNLEWVFNKADINKNNIEKIIDLGQAVQRLPETWDTTGENSSFIQLEKLLGVASENPLRSQLIEDVEKCLPPVHELSEWNHGLSILRWLLHRILPYPSFLWDEYYLAARLRITPAKLNRVLADGKHLRKRLASCEYKGILSKFSGPRWWRSLIEQFLWKETKGNSSDPDAIFASVLKEKRVRGKNNTKTDYPIVCLDENYKVLEQFHSVETSVRIQPDDWPAYAEQAWTTIELAKLETKLRAMVIHEDRPKIK